MREEQQRTFARCTRLMSIGRGRNDRLAERRVNDGVAEIGLIRSTLACLNLYDGDFNRLSERLALNGEA